MFRSPAHRRVPSRLIAPPGVIPAPLRSAPLRSPLRHFPRVKPFYAIKCNPDPVVVRTLATLGANFDCASRQEIELVQDLTKDLPRTPEIVYANPCKARSHIAEAVRRGVTLMTFDNMAEVGKCASVSRSIRLILRIITDDAGSSSRLSLKFGAPRSRWRGLLSEARRFGLDVVGVSFHVGSGCRDASKYDLALRDAREIFDVAKRDFGFDFSILDIGGGFPGETHSLINPTALDGSGAYEDNDEDDEDDVDDDDDDAAEEKKESGGTGRSGPYMFFNEIADHVAPVLDRLFPEESGVRIIAEPGRYLVAASSTLLVNVVAVGQNSPDDESRPVSDREATRALAVLTRDEEDEIVNGRQRRGTGADRRRPDTDFRSLMREVADHSRRFARQELAQQEVDAYADRTDFSVRINESMSRRNLGDLPDLLSGLGGGGGGSPGDGRSILEGHTAEGVFGPIVRRSIEDERRPAAEEGGGGEGGGGGADADLGALAAAGEAAIAGAVLEAVASTLPRRDDFSYYVNDGVYGAFNNIMFDHAAVRPRLLRNLGGKKRRTDLSASMTEDGFWTLEPCGSSGSDGEAEGGGGRRRQPLPVHHIRPDVRLHRRSGSLGAAPQA